MTTRSDGLQPEAGRPTLLVEKVALVGLFVLTFGATLIRVDVTDTPWHLATARWAFEKGHWPTVNTFSWTHPDYPLQQQYPVYQAMIYAAYRLGSWEGLSVFHALIWTAIFALAIAWGGGFRWASHVPFLWALGILGMQRRMILRPDIGTFLILFGLLLAIDAYRRGRTWTVVLFVIFQWLFANAHQLFPIGLAIQGAVFLEALADRLWPGRFAAPDRSRPLPIAPITIAIVASCIACLFTPLGWQIVYTPMHTASSLSHHRMYLQEFRPIWTDPYTFTIAGLCALATLWSFIRVWPRASIFEILLWLLVGALAASAVRGAALFCIVSIGLAARNLQQAATRSDSASVAATLGIGAPFVVFARVLISIAIMVACVGLLKGRWFDTDRNLLGLQPGVGKRRGWWPDKAIEFIKADPPPGNMLNLGWHGANSMIWGLYPDPRIFVDPRFEAFPREFLLDAIAAEKDPAVLNRLLKQFDPLWLVGEIRTEEIRGQFAKLATSGQWELVYFDGVFMILVRNNARTADYRKRHIIDPATFTAGDIDESHPEIACFQHLLIGDFLERLADARPENKSLRTRANAELEAARKAGKGMDSFDAQWHLRRARK